MKGEGESEARRPPKTREVNRNLGCLAVTGVTGGAARSRREPWETAAPSGPVRVSCAPTVTATVTLAVTAEEAGGYRWSSLDAAGRRWMPMELPDAAGPLWSSLDLVRMPLELAGTPLDSAGMPLGCCWRSLGALWSSPRCRWTSLELAGCRWDDAGMPLELVAMPLGLAGTSPGCRWTPQSGDGLGDASAAWVSRRCPVRAGGLPSAHRLLLVLFHLNDSGDS